MCELLKTDTDILELDVEVTIQSDPVCSSNPFSECRSTVYPVCLSVSQSVDVDWPPSIPEWTSSSSQEGCGFVFFLSSVLVSSFADSTNFQAFLQKVKPLFQTLDHCAIRKNEKHRQKAQEAWVCNQSFGSNIFPSVLLPLATRGIQKYADSVMDWKMPQNLNLWIFFFWSSYLFFYQLKKYNNVASSWKKCSNLKCYVFP